MRFEFLAVLYGLAMALPVFPADYDSEARAALALAAARVAPDAEPAPPDTTAPLTYEAARARALWYQKPLVVWVGKGVCPGCIAKMDGEVVSCVVSEFEGVPSGGGLVVGVPEDGDLLRVATVTEWTTGDATYGHVPSIRRALSAWRTHRLTQRSGWSRGVEAKAAYRQPAVGWSGPPSFAPPVMRTAPRRGG